MEGQTYRQTDRHVDKQVGGWMDGGTGGHVDIVQMGDAKMYNSISGKEISLCLADKVLCLLFL